MRNNHITVSDVLGVKLFFLTDMENKTLYAVAYKKGKIYELPSILRKFLKFKNS